MKPTHFKILLISGFLCVHILSHTLSAETSAKIPIPVPHTEKPDTKKKPTFFSIGLGVTAKLQAGAGYEYVFNRSGSVLSRLEWQTLPAQAFGLNTELYCAGGWHLFFSADFFLPLHSGRMTDKDFMGAILTQFSEHKNYLKSGMQYNLTLGILRPLTEKRPNRVTISAEPLIGVMYFFHRWDAADGYTQYAYNTEVTEATPKTVWHGKAASYTQKILLPTVGILFKFDLPKQWEIKTAFQICPQVLAAAEDLHYGKNTAFYDEFSKKGFSLHFNLYAEKKLTDVLHFFAAAGYTTAVSYNGKTTAYNMQTGEAESASGYGAAGTALHIGNIGAGLIFRIGRL